MFTGFLDKCLSLLPNFHENWNILTMSYQPSQYEIQCKSFVFLKLLYADGHTDRAKIIGTALNCHRKHIKE